MSTKTIAILFFEGVEELDAVGPLEVLAGWTRYWPGDGWRTISTGLTGNGSVRGTNGLVMTPETGIESAGPIDILVYPGGKGARQLATDADHLLWMRERAERIPVLVSVCTGALVLAAAGLLKGRPATTHWGALEKLAAIDETIDVRPDSRFVDDGDVVTAAGVSAGIDVALHLVARLAGDDRARDVCRFLQYDPGCRGPHASPPGMATCDRAS